MLLLLRLQKYTLHLLNSPVLKKTNLIINGSFPRISIDHGMQKQKRPSVETHERPLSNMVK